jgi:hypothetical protein
MPMQLRTAAVLKCFGFRARGPAEMTCCERQLSVSEGLPHGSLTRSRRAAGVLGNVKRQGLGARQSPRNRCPAGVLGQTPRHEA